MKLKQLPVVAEDGVDDSSETEPSSLKSKPYRDE